MNIPRPSTRPSANAYRLADITPEAMRALRILFVLALVGAAVLATGQVMSKAQAPARRLMGV